MAGKRNGKKQETFEFKFEGNTYAIRQRYNGQPTTLVLTDGKIVQVTVWQMCIPCEPIADSIETFDPKLTDAAQLARARGGFMAELVTSNGTAKE